MWYSTLFPDYRVALESFKTHINYIVWVYLFVGNRVVGCRAALRYSQSCIRALYLESCEPCPQHGYYDSFCSFVWFWVSLSPLIQWSLLLQQQQILIFRRARDTLTVYVSVSPPLCEMRSLFLALGLILIYSIFWQVTVLAAMSRNIATTKCTTSHFQSGLLMLACTLSSSLSTQRYGITQTVSNWSSNQNTL